MNNFFDNVMWYLIYLMPLFLWLGVSIRVGQFSTLLDTFNMIGLNVLPDNIVLATFGQIFDLNGILPLFATADILVYLTYFVSVYLIHLAVDFLLFIPRLSHKWLKSFTSGGSD